MKLMMFVPLWKRPEITEICFMGIERLRKAGVHGVDAFAVISEEEMIPVCDKYKVHHVMHENQPLGAKKNYGLREALKLDWDYLVEIGSDDLIKTEYLTLFPWDRDLMSLMDAVWLDSKTGRARRIKDRTGKFGAGRALSRKVCDQITPMWHDRKFNGLDGDSMFRMGRAGFLGQAFESPKPLVIDIKSEVNIWEYHNVGHPYTLEEVLDGLSEQEQNAIRCLVTKNKSADLTGA